MSAPRHELDSGVAALTLIGSSLHANALLNGELDRLRDVRIQWPEKLNASREWIDRFRDDVVLLCDEPTSWVADTAGFSDASNRLSRELIHWLLYDAPVRRIVAGWFPDRPSNTPHFATPTVDDPRSLFQETDLRAAQAVFERLMRIGDSIPAGKTPLYYRILLSLACITSVEYVEKGLSHLPSESYMVDRILKFIGRGERWSALRTALLRFALARIPVPANQAVELTVGLTDRGRVICKLLSQESEEGVRLHGIVRTDILSKKAPEWKLDDTELTRTHSLLEDAYVAQAGSAGEVVHLKMEAFHHSVFRDEQQQFAGAPFFVEQLLAAGRSLSLHKRYKKAASLFQVAIEFDPSCDYGHHYFAFNLDALAQQTAQVEQHYQRAIELNPLHPWWRSRWITYLVTRGRPREARDAWEQAVNELSVSPDSPPELYKSLHKWVIRWLLHWVQLDFAESVMASVPMAILREDAGFRALSKLHRALRAAENRLVMFPLSIPRSRWWYGPHLDLPRSVNGKELREWRPARVQHIEDETVHLLIGERPKTTRGEPEYGYFEFGKDEMAAAAYGFRCRDLAPGTFLELAFYGDDGEMRIALHRDQMWHDPNLPPLLFEPNRYVVVPAEW
jgi:hypothetical protein